MSVLTALGAALHIPAPDCASPAEGPRPNHGLPCALLRGGITRPWQQHGQGQACTARQPAALGNARGAARFVCRRPASPVTAPRAASGDAPAEWCAFARPSGPYASGCWENARQARRHTHAARAQTRRACRGPQARAPPRAPPRPVRPRRAQRTVQYRASRARPAAPRPRAAAPPARTGILSRRYRRHRRHRRSQQCAHPHPPARAASPSADPLDWVRTEEHSEQFGTPVFFLLCRTTGSWTHICDASQSSSQHGATAREPPGGAGTRGRGGRVRLCGQLDTLPGDAPLPLLPALARRKRAAAGSALRTARAEHGLDRDGSPITAAVRGQRRCGAPDRVHVGSRRLARRGTRG